LAFWNGTEWVRDELTPKPRRRHRLWGASAEAGLITLLIFGLIAGSTLAAKGGQRGGKPGSGGGTISLAPLVYDANGNGLPNYGDRATFTVSTTATDKPWVELDCYQGGVLVYQDRRGFFDGSLTGEVFNLGTTAAWQSGAADCTAWLVKYTRKGWSKLASTNFHVEV
jgi:hypothetical protein